LYGEYLNLIKLLVLERKVKLVYSLQTFHIRVKLYTRFEFFVQVYFETDLEVLAELKHPDKLIIKPDGRV